MSRIDFHGIEKDELSTFKAVFKYIAHAKVNETFNEVELFKLMGARAETHFIQPTKEDADEMLKAWKLNPSISLPWDFGSWFDALNSAEIAYTSLDVGHDGVGTLIFEQLAWPSGGIDATVELIRAFGGEVTFNDAI